VELADAYKSRRGRSPQFSIAISTQQSMLPSGSELKVKAEIKNESAYAINSAEDCSLELDVSYEDGMVSVPKKQSWLKLRRQPNLRRVGVETMPGETQKCVFAVSDMYEMARPGRYLIQMKRRDFWGTVVKSNVLRVTVIAPHASAEISSLLPTAAIATNSINAATSEPRE
jgi:hypothetical protein